MPGGRPRTKNYELLGVVGKMAEPFARGRNLSPDVIACVANERNRNQAQIGRGARKRVHRLTDGQIVAQSMRKRVQFVQELWEGMQSA